MTKDKTVTMSRELESIRKLAELACGTSKDSPEYKRFLAAMNPTLLLDLTAAPVVERKSDPVGQWSDDDGVSWCDGNERSLQSARESGWKTRTLYSATPELAELQATIARLTAEVTEWKDTVKFNEGCWSEERGTMIDKLQTARAEIERLKGGPVFYIGEPLRNSVAETPAPVEVVLPSSQEMHVLISKAARQADLTPGANYFTASEFAAIAIIDKVKELNQ